VAVNSVHNPAYEAAALEARFRIAARHSRLVRALRIAVPAAVLLAMAVIVGVSVFNPFRMLMPKLPIDTGNLLVSGTKITMESPHLAGYTPDQRPYELWAKTATQDLRDPDHVDLDKLRTKVVMEDGSIAFVDARTGKFDNKQQTLDLHKDIFMKTSNGYEARLSQAFVDMAKNTVTSDEHVDVKMTNGTVSSDRLRIYGGGEVVRFEGNVVMNLDHLDTGDGSTQQADAAPAPVEQVPTAPTQRTTRSAKSGNASGSR
jgi:lipopolysaccharide export system protein LptC